MSKVSIVIVTYNGLPWIDKCLESLTSEEGVAKQIIIVDNNSKDETVNYIKRNFHGIIIFEQVKNLGFGKANNIGISYALNNGADYIFLLNQDAFVQKNSLKKLIMVSKEHPEFGILSPIHLNWEGSKLEYYFSKFILKNLDIYSDFVLNKELKSLYEVQFINAAAWLIPRRTFEIVGGFDPIFYHYGEDNNYCQRLRYHRLKLGVVPNSFIFHDSKKRNDHIDFLFTDAYYLQEVKKFQIKYANINDSYSEKDLRKELIKIHKLILINALKCNGRAVRGYLKKNRIFENNIRKILQSRERNIVAKANYLNL